MVEVYSVKSTRLHLSKHMSASHTIEFRRLPFPFIEGMSEDICQEAPKLHRYHAIRENVDSLFSRWLHRVFFVLLRFALILAVSSAATASAQNVTVSSASSAHLSTSQNTIFLFGRNFGTSNSSSRSQTGASASMATLWRSDTFVACRTTNGVGSRWSITVSVMITRASLTGVLSFATASLSDMGIAGGLTQQLNLPTSGCISATVLGRNFGSWDYSGNLRSGGRNAVASFAPGCIREIVFVGSSYGPKEVVLSRWARCPATVSSANWANAGETWGDRFSVTHSIDRDIITVRRVDACCSWGMELKIFCCINILRMTASEAFAWKSSSSIASKASSGLGDATFWILQGLPVSLTIGLQPGARTQAWHYDVAVWKSVGGRGNIPSSGSRLVTVLGTGFGGQGLSGQSRFAESALRATRWASYSCIHLRMIAGASQLNMTMLISIKNNRHELSMIATLTSALSYDFPFLSAINSWSLKDNRVTGSNFGGHDAARRFQISCSAGSASQSEASICQSNMSYPLQIGLKITQAVISVSNTASNSAPLKLDAVTFSLRFYGDRSESPSNFILMKHKCSCFSSFAFNFAFDLLTPGLPIVPISGCLPTGRYSPEEADGIIEALAQPGTWSLMMAGDGSAYWSGTKSSISFVTESLQFRIGASLASAVSWFSDSSATFQVPRYQNGTSGVSGGGHGHSLPITAVINRLSSPQNYFVNFSYPDPFVTNLSSYVLPTTANTNLAIFGHAFANIASSPGARFKSTGCAGSLWTSDTSVTCHLPSLRGRTKLLTLSIAFSAIASISSDLVQGTPNLLSTSFDYIASSSSSAVSVLGASFGNIENFSVRVRGQKSAFISTMWVSDSTIVSRLPHLIGASSVIVSLCDFKIAVPAFNHSLLNFLVAPVINGHLPNILASTGSSMLHAVGLYGTTSESFLMALSGSSCMGTYWTSHSSLHCKTAWIVGAPLAISVSAALVHSHTTAPKEFFSAPKVSNLLSFGNSSRLNSTTCYFENASICSHSQIVSFVSNASGFGTYPNLIKVFLGGQPCDHVTWLSDSALYCAYKHAISKALFTLNFTVTMSTLANMTFTSFLSVDNPLFVPKSPQVNTSLFSAFDWGDEVISNEAIERYSRQGRFSGETVKPRRNSTAVAEYFETFSVKVIVYINDTVNVDSRIFLDSEFRPISKTVSGKFSLFNASSGLDASAIFCSPQSAQNITLFPETYAAFTTVEMTFCSLAAGEVSLIFRSSTIDEYHRIVHLPVDIMPLFVRAHGPASVNVSWQSISNFVVGKSSSTSLLVLYRAGSALQCSRTRFEFVVALECHSHIGQSSAFVFKLSRSGDRGSIFPMSVMNCNATLSDLWFMVPSSRCILNVSVPSTGLFAISPPFVVMSGTGTSFKLLGPQVNCESAGALIWSIFIGYNSTQRCLAVQLLDEEGNNASSSPLQVKAVAKDSSNASYALLSLDSYNITTSGVVLWCALYSTNITQKLVFIGIYVGENVEWLPGQLNFSLPGTPAQLSIVPSSNRSSIPLLPGQMPPAVRITMFDVARNELQQTAKHFIIRIRVKPKRRVFPSRNLLQSSDLELIPPCQSLSYINISAGSPGSIEILPLSLCAAGENEILYDIGEMDGQGTFSVSILNFELKTTVTVIPGLFETFTVNAVHQLQARSYFLIRDVEILFLDSGFNFVSGNASMTLSSLNASVHVYPSAPFYVFSNVSVSDAAKLPPFYISFSNWNSSMHNQLIHVSLAGSIRSSRSSLIALNATFLCPKGHKLNFPSDKAGSDRVYEALLAHRNVTCTPCDVSAYHSWLNDASECITLQYPAAPRMLISGRAVAINDVTAITDSGVVAAHVAINWTVILLLQRPSSSGAAINCSVVLQKGRSTSATAIPTYLEQPDSNYVWFLELYPYGTSNAPVFIISLPIAVTVLDFSPGFLRIEPSSLSYAGLVALTITGTFPSDASPRGFFSSIAAPSVRNDSCLFTASSSYAKQFTLVANRSINTNSTVSLVCGPLLEGVTGPVSTSWTATMLLSDGRQSAHETPVDSYCPTGFFVTNSSAAASQLMCVRCPQTRSTSITQNSYGERSCVCNENHYGTYGDQCIACPKNVDGFNCSLLNQSWPSIKAGFYIDYSLMSSCSENGVKCDAIIKCPNPSACPGRTEKDCLQTAEQCYDSETFGCTACCPRYYIENFVCRPCPPSQLPIILGLATVGLILFAVFSSSFDFPPLVSAAQSLKVFLSSMQGFVSIRLLAISWPPVVLSMFDFTRFFTFSFDVLRPECTVDYTPRTKLQFVLIGPWACAFFICLMVFTYTAFKCWKMCYRLRDDRVQNITKRSFKQTVISVAQCLVASSLCLKFSNSRMMADGALWNALNPTLARRSDTVVLMQKQRRKGVLQRDSEASSAQACTFPQDWTLMQEVITELHVEPEFARSAKRFRRLLASAMSIFVFTFQGSIEAALSTFDCKDTNGVLFLRSNPKVQCSSSSSMYSSMITMSVIGLVVYCVLLPTITIVTLRSLWCREMHMHDSVAYSQMFGFLTSAYSKTCSLWEMVACVRKVVFIAIPILVSKEALVQSVSMFSFLIFYAFALVKMQPMANSVLNQIETLSCVSIIIGSFASIFFVVEFNGKLVLTGSSRDLAGLILVLVCAACALRSIKLMKNDFSRLMLMHKDVFVTKWVAGITAQMAGMCEEKFVIPVIALFYNNAATADILKSKLNMQLKLASFTHRAQILSQLPWYSLGTRIVQSFKLWRERLAFRLSIWRSQPPPEAIDQCLESSEFKFLQYLHKLTLRMQAWRTFDKKHLPAEQLPTEFRTVKGPSDPPQAEYSFLCRVQELANSFIPADMQQTMFAVMLAEKLASGRELSPSHREYKSRLNDLLLDFASKFSDVDAIFHEASAAEHKHHQAPTQWWQRIHKDVLRRFTKEPERVLEFLPTLDTNHIIGIATRALGAVSLVHRSFQENTAPTAAHQSISTAYVIKSVKSVCDSSPRDIVARHSHVGSIGNVLSHDGPADSAIEMSTFFPSVDSSAANDFSATKADASQDCKYLPKVHLTARRLAVFSSRKSETAHLKIHGVPEVEAGSTELQEVVISNGGSGAAEGIEKVHTQRHQPATDSAYALQRDVSAAGGDCAPLEAESKATVVHKKTLPALVLNPRGRGSVNSLIAAIQRPVGARNSRDEGHEMERLPDSSGAALPPTSALPRPQLRPPPSALAASSQREVFEVTAQIRTHQPSSPSHSRAHHPVASANQPATAAIVPQPPPRSRSSSRSRISAKAAGAHALADSDATLQAIQGVPFGMPSHAAAALQPPSSAKHPDAAAQASGGSVRTGKSSKKAESMRSGKKHPQVQKSAKDGWNESMRRAREQGIQFEEC